MHDSKYLNHSAEDVNTTATGAYDRLEMEGRVAVQAAADEIEKERAVEEAVAKAAREATSGRTFAVFSYASPFEMPVGDFSPSANIKAMESMIREALVAAGLGITGASIGTLYGRTVAGSYFDCDTPEAVHDVALLTIEGEACTAAEILEVLAQVVDHVHSHVAARHVCLWG